MEIKCNQCGELFEKGCIGSHRNQSKISILEGLQKTIKWYKEKL